MDTLLPSSCSLPFSASGSSGLDTRRPCARCVTPCERLTTALATLLLLTPVHSCAPIGRNGRPITGLETRRPADSAEHHWCGRSHISQPSREYLHPTSTVSTRFTHRTHLYLPLLLPRRSLLVQPRPGCRLNRPRMPRLTWFPATTGWQPM